MLRIHRKGKHHMPIHHISFNGKLWRLTEGQYRRLLWSIRDGNIPDLDNYGRGAGFVEQLDDIVYVQQHKTLEAKP
jgi:hypothetical protein